MAAKDEQAVLVSVSRVRLLVQAVDFLGELGLAVQDLVEQVFLPLEFYRVSHHLMVSEVHLAVAQASVASVAVGDQNIDPGFEKENFLGFVAV